MSKFHYEKTNNKNNRKKIKRLKHRGLPAQEMKIFEQGNNATEGPGLEGRTSRTVVILEKDLLFWQRSGNLGVVLVKLWLVLLP